MAMFSNDNNNDNNYKQGDIYGAAIMVQSHCKSSPVHQMNTDSASDGCQLPDQDKQLGL